MKKLISVLLAVVMLFSLTSVAFAAEEVVPVVVVSGMGRPLYEVKEDGSRVQVWGPQTDSIVKAVVELAPALIKAIVTDDYTDLPNHTTALTDMFGRIAHNPDGTPKYEIVTDLYPKSIGNYMDDDFFANPGSGEGAICRGIADEVGYDNTYFFSYDWTNSAITLAAQLNDYIENVKAEKNADKVKIVACSMGGTITMAYLADYGYDSVDTVVMASTAFLGTEIVGQLFSKKMDISIDAVLAYFGEFIGYDFMPTLFSIITTAINMNNSDLIASADDAIDSLVRNLDVVLYSELFMDTFVTLPGFWSLIPAAYYEEAKTALFTDREEYGFLEAEIDHYIYDVQSNAQKIIAEAQLAGVKYYVTATYLCPGIPVYENYTNYTDNLVDLNYSSGMATVAPYGTTLDPEAVNENAICTDDTHNHISADLIIDASSCFLPERTWFVKGVGHMGYMYKTPMCDLVVYLVTSEEYVDIYSNPEYPQFTEYDGDENKLVSLTGYAEEIPARDTLADLIKLLVKQLISLIAKLFGIGG